MKVFELAKQLNIAPLDLVQQLKERNIPVKNHMSSLSEADIAKFETLKDKKVIPQKMEDKILATKVSEKELIKMAERKEKQKKKKQVDFPKVCVRAINELANSIQFTRSDEADHLYNILRKLMMENPEEFSKKARDRFNLGD